MRTFGLEQLVDLGGRETSDELFGESVLGISERFQARTRGGECQGDRRRGALLQRHKDL